MFNLIYHKGRTRGPLVVRGPQFQKRWGRWIEKHGLNFTFYFPEIRAAVDIVTRDTTKQKKYLTTCGFVPTWRKNPNDELLVF